MQATSQVTIQVVPNQLLLQLPRDRQGLARLERALDEFAAYVMSITGAGPDQYEAHAEQLLAYMESEVESQEQMDAFVFEANGGSVVGA